MRSARGSTDRTRSSDTVQGGKHVPSSTPVGTIDKQWLRYGEVFRAPDQSGARRLFALGKAAGTGCFWDFPFNTQNLVFPRFGDEQFGRLGTDADGVHVMVFVRTGSVVWGLGAAAIPKQFKATQAQSVAVLKTYTARQQRRVGHG